MPIYLISQTTTKNIKILSIGNEKLLILLTKYLLKSVYNLERNAILFISNIILTL